MGKLFIGVFICFVLIALFFFFKETSSEKENVSQRLLMLIKDEEITAMNNLLAFCRSFFFLSGLWL